MASNNADDSRESIVLLAGDGTNIPSDAWFLDTGATQHMTHSALLLTNVGAPGDVTRVVFGNDKSLPVVRVGITRLIIDGGLVNITNVLHVLGLKVNLLSVTQLVKKGVKVTIDDAKMDLFWKGKQFAQGVLNGELYQLKTHPRVASSNVAQGSKATLKVWHNRLAHANYDSVKELANKGHVKGFDVIAGDDEKGICAACVEGKMARKPFGSRTSPLAKDPLAIVHMDVCGLMRHASKGGERFLLVMLDDATRMCWTRLLKAKGDVTKAIQEWALEVCDNDKKRIKAICIDGGGEFVNAELEKWMKSKGIKHGVTTPYTPQQNGAAERLNRTLAEAVRSLLQHWSLGASDGVRRVRWRRGFATICRRRCSRDDSVRSMDQNEAEPIPPMHLWVPLLLPYKFPTKEQPTPQLTVILLPREEDEAMEVPSQVEREAENGGGENEESDDDMVEVPSTAVATSSTPSSLPLALTRKQRTCHPNTKYTDYAT
ncbi:unnamed protein product [Closterium sp. NIES-54]